MFRDFNVLEAHIKKIFKNHKVASIQSDESSASIFINIYKKYNLRLKNSLKTLRGKSARSNLHRPTFYTYIILAGAKIKKLLNVIQKELPTGQGMKSNC